MAFRNRGTIPCRNAPAPENVPLVDSSALRKFRGEHSFALAAAFFFIFSTLFAISLQGSAQEYRVGVSARVLPIGSYAPWYSEMEFAKLNIFQRFWIRLDTNQRLMYISGSGLAALIIPMGVYVLRHHRMGLRAIRTVHSG